MNLPNELVIFNSKTSHILHAFALNLDFFQQALGSQKYMKKKKLDVFILCGLNHFDRYLSKHRLNQAHSVRTHLHIL